MTVPITASMLYDLIACPHRVRMDIHSDPADRDPINPFVEMLWQKGSLYEQEVIKGLQVPFLDLSIYAGNEKEQRTTDAMKRGVALIYSGRIRDGKTHSLLLLYHLASTGEEAPDWQGVARLRELAGVKALPLAKVAVFVGTEFDPISGRGGSDSTPLRQTPWGEIAYQLGGDAALEVLKEHERQRIAPGGGVIRRFGVPHGRDQRRRDRDPDARYLQQPVVLSLQLSLRQTNNAGRRGMPFHKTAHASEQQRPDVLRRRRASFDVQPERDPTMLVFVDETGGSTKMAPRLVDLAFMGFADEGDRFVECRHARSHRHVLSPFAALRRRDESVIGVRLWFAFVVSDKARILKQQQRE